MSDENMDVVENENENDDNESESSDAEEDMKEGPSSSRQAEADAETVYLPGNPLEEGEELVCDQSAYIMLHQAQTGAPCLSFDVVPDSLGDDRETYPLSAYIVAGTQAQQVHVNNIIVMKLSNLHKTTREGEDDEDESDDEDEDEDQKPKMAGALMKHQGCVNRIRVWSIKNVYELQKDA